MGRAVRVVELAGPPGAGKTALAEALRAHVDAAGGRAVAGERRLPGRAAVAAARFVARHPQLVGAAVRALAGAAAPWPARVLTLRRFLRDGAHRELARALDADVVVVFGEGLVQRAIGLCVEPGRPARAAAAAHYARRLPLGGVTVLVQAPLATCLARLAQRERPRRLREAPPAVLEAFVRAGAETVELACDVLAGRGGAVVAVDNDGDLDVALGRIWRALELGAPATAVGGRR